ncbi:Tim44 domain-containing protein [Roseococcus sp. SYP-B2431]|uniref:Tim44/TimA family putative adaptor protein n=1 Tax=Roseococcus sp. SYP-B2431 TaxID=2496640 RepID=UPI00103FF34B|nr:Tim44/TimA family putative adaptor protein [Roseococcus sp. SYP-B2431]TCH98995.1 Tim44 domain-containing protein [Roseococcus sp. SYP-B2431]
MSGGFPIDLILFAMVAAFLVLRLRSVLGKRQGFERPPATPGLPEARTARVEAVTEDIAAARADGARRTLPPSSSAAGQGLARIAAVDPSFEPNAFLDGAEGAFRMIVAAFAQGDRQTLRGLLSDDTYAGFEQAVTARENAGESQRTEIRAMQEIAVEGAALNGNLAEVTVRFVSDQVNITTRNQEIVAGADAVTEVVDIWTFQRDVSQKDPTWKLTATRSG